MVREQSLRWYLQPIQTKISRRVVGAWVSESERTIHTKRDKDIETHAQ